MLDENQSQIFSVFNRYILILENPVLSQLITPQIISEMFSCCLFVEAAVARARKECKSQIFDNHLRDQYRRNNRSNMYMCSDLEKACDKVLETYIRDSSVSTSLVDQLVDLYVRYCGRERLNAFLKDLLTESMCASAIVKSLLESGLPVSRVEDEALLASWEDEVGSGRQEAVSSCINKMLDDGRVSSLLEFVSRLDESRETKRLIVQSFTSRAFQNDVPLMLALAEVDRKLFYTFVKDHPNFRISFIDALFHFGRNMKYAGGMWISDSDFKYDHLLGFIEMLLEGSSEIYDLTSETLQLAKEQPDGLIWRDIEKHFMVVSPYNTDNLSLSLEERLKKESSS